MLKLCHIFHVKANLTHNVKRYCQNDLFIILQNVHNT